jgi:hypothetical protein
MKERKKGKNLFNSTVRLLIIAAMKRLVKRFLFEALVMVFYEVAAVASAMAAQALREFCLSVFFASVNSRNDCSFDYALFADNS